MNMIGTPPLASTPTLSIDMLCKRYRKMVALDQVTFTVPAASLTVILGPAGAGKTTTLRLVAGLEKPDSGSVQIGGRDVVHLEPKDRDVAMIFDNLALYPNKSGFENIASPLRIRGEDQEVIEEKVADLAATLKVSHILRRLPKTMSGGERQRIALGRALIRSPKLFLLDEPLSSLDAKLRIELRAELKRLQRELGHTFVLATPDYQEAMAIADTIIVLREGAIVQVAPPQELYDAPVDSETAEFVGAPLINLLDAVLEADGGTGQAALAGMQIPLPEHLQFLRRLAKPSFRLGIRPENLTITAPEQTQLRAAVTDIEPLGLKSVVTVKKESTTLRIVVKSTQLSEVSVGQNVGIAIIDQERLLAFDSSDGQLLRDVG